MGATTAATARPHLRRSRLGIARQQARGNRRRISAANADPVSLQDQENPHRQWYRVQLQSAGRNQKTQKQGASVRQNLPRTQH